MVNTPTGVSVMARKTLKDQIRFEYQFYLMMSAVGRNDEAKRALNRLDAIIDGINPALKAVNTENLKQDAKYYPQS